MIRASGFSDTKGVQIDGWIGAIMTRNFRPLIGWSDVMIALRDEIAQIASTQLTVMIRGERGTGKENEIRSSPNS
jgi:transcriptional regulator with GAF, ATPase, and Fis domain